MKRVHKITAWIVGGVVLLAICVIGGLKLRDIFMPEFEETKIYPDENRDAPSDTIINANGVMIKMIGVKGVKSIAEVSKGQLIWRISTLAKPK